MHGSRRQLWPWTPAGAASAEGRAGGRSRGTGRPLASLQGIGSPTQRGSKLQSVSCSVSPLSGFTSRKKPTPRA